MKITWLKRLLVSLIIPALAFEPAMGNLGPNVLGQSHVLVDTAGFKKQAMANRALHIGREQWRRFTSGILHGIGAGYYDPQSHVNGRSNFGTFLTGWFVSSAALNMLMIGLTTQLKLLSSNPLDFGWFQALTTLPVFGLSLAAGKMADKHSPAARIRSLQVLQAVPFLTSIGLIVLHFTHRLTIGHLLASAFLFGTVLAVQYPVMQWINQDMVDRGMQPGEEALRAGRFMNAIGRERAVNGAGRLGGALLAMTLLIGLPPVALLMAAVIGIGFFIGKAEYFIRRFSRQPTAVSLGETSLPARPAAVGVIGLLFGVVILADILGNALPPLLAPASEKLFDMPLYYVGWLVSSWIFGAIAASYYLSKLAKKLPKLSSLWRPLIVLGISIGLFASVQSPTVGAFTVTLAGCSLAFLNLTAISWLVSHGRGTLGRRMALFSMASSGSGTLGAFLAGALSGQNGQHISNVLHWDAGLLAGVGLAYLIVVVLRALFERHYGHSRVLLQEPALSA